MVISGVLHHGESVLVSYFCKVDLDQNLVFFRNILRCINSSILLDLGLFMLCITLDILNYNVGDPISHLFTFSTPDPFISHESIKPLFFILSSAE